MEIPEVPFGSSGNPETQNGLGVEKELKAHLVQPLSAMGPSISPSPVLYRLEHFQA